MQQMRHQQPVIRIGGDLSFMTGHLPATPEFLKEVAPLRRDPPPPSPRTRRSGTVWKAIFAGAPGIKTSSAQSRLLERMNLLSLPLPVLTKVPSLKHRRWKIA